MRNCETFKHKNSSLNTSGCFTFSTWRRSWAPVVPRTILFCQAYANRLPGSRSVAVVKIQSLTKHARCLGLSTRRLRMRNVFVYRSLRGTAESTFRLSITLKSQAAKTRWSCWSACEHPAFATKKVPAGGKVQTMQTPAFATSPHPIPSWPNSRTAPADAIQAKPKPLDEDVFAKPPKSVFVPSDERVRCWQRWSCTEETENQSHKMLP